MRPRWRAAICGLALLVAAPACLRSRPVDPASLGGQAATSLVFAADGTLLTTLHAEQDRRPLGLARIPTLLVDAVLAVEDRRFYQHRGVDYRGIARAAVKDASRLSADEGGSTITQQLVKNTLVTPERSVRRKVKEAALALGLERTLTKDQILERYLNTVYFGEGAYGVGAAIRVYFGRGPEQVSAAEAALLAGLIRAPSRTSPLRDPAAARTRRAQAIAAMVKTRVIDTTQAGEANAAPLPTRAYRDTTRFPAAYAVADAVSTLLTDPRLGSTDVERLNAVYRGGLRIHLTIDRELQRLAELAVAEVLTAPNDPAAAIAAVVPGDGAITAMVGGRDFFSTRDPQARVNLARGGITKRQAGSTFKVFALIAALNKGITPNDMFEGGARVVLQCQCPKPWVVDNYEGGAYGRITLRRATERSVNTAYARIVRAVGDGSVDRGMNTVLDVAESLGMHGPRGTRLRRDSGPAVVLGAQEVDPVELAAAYAALGAGGVYAKPYLISKVTTANGRALLENRPVRKQVIAPGIAAIANDVLTGVIRRGTGINAALTRPMAGKTGTSTNYHDAWFAGYTPNFAAAVWLGDPRKQTAMLPENGFRTVIAGGTFPAQIWARFAKPWLLGREAPRFASPAESTVTVEIDVERDCLPNEFTPRSFIEKRPYLKGTEPTRVCIEPTGPPARSVPDVLGFDVDAARRSLDRVGFRVTVEEVYDRRFRPGVVVGQFPAAGTSVEPGSPVSLRVSGGPNAPVVVPDVLGQEKDAARSTLEGAGLVARVLIEPSCTGGESCQQRLDREAGLVWRQNTPAGSKVRRGTTVTISVGPRAG